ncbi:serine/threonine-protein kinase drkB [Globisporangium polare]
MSQAIDQTEGVTSSAFSKLLTFLIVLIVGVIAIIALVTYCCYKRNQYAAAGVGGDVAPSAPEIESHPRPGAPSY